MDQYPGELLAAADKYQLKQLKTLCEKHLIASTISIDSVATLLLLSDLHQASELKQRCIDFITDNVIEVMKTQAWKLLVENRIELTVELLQQLALKTVTYHNHIHKHNNNNQQQPLLPPLLPPSQHHQHSHHHNHHNYQQQQQTNSNNSSAYY